MPKGEGAERLLRHRAARSDPVRQRLSLDELHHHVAGVIRLEEAHHAHDVGMAERRERLGLGHEALQAPLERFGRVLRPGLHRAVLAARGEVARQVLLQRNLETEVAVGGKISQAEAAGT
ncbi:hypothetical protein D3C83_50310 [compost metagenome]